MQNKKTIAIIGAMECETVLLKNILENTKEVKAGRFSVIEGNFNNNLVIIATCGVGKVCAATCTQFLIDKFNPDFIINTGIAGGIASNLSVGDIVIATELVHHDFDVTALGYAKGYICNGVEPNKPTIFYSDKNLVEHFEKAILNIIPQQHLHKGLVASGDMFVGNIEKKIEIKNMFNAVACEMEGSAIAQSAYLNNTPFIIIRAISDLADGAHAENQNDFERETAKISSAAIKTILMSI